MGERKMTTKLVLVGGFLGAGKTTLLAKMASIMTNPTYRFDSVV